MMKRCLIALFMLILPTLSWALATTMELGVRGGTHANGLDENYTAGEVYYLYTLPWQKELGSGRKVYARIDAGAGYLYTDARRGGWVAAGGDLVLSLLDGALELECGLRPTWLTEDEFGDDNFGGPVQFSSHVGLTYNIGNTALSYRYQHISNAHIYDENPGLDLHLVGLGVRF